MLIRTFDNLFIDRMRRFSMPMLRMALGVIFLWFGLLKIFGASPVVELIGSTYSFLPKEQFVLFVGIWEAAIGLGLIGKFALRATLALLWLQMSGTFVALVLAPDIFFLHGNPLLLTLEGEFVMKNIVLITASLVIGGHEIKTPYG